jgi:hypothetical protein
MTATEYQFRSVVVAVHMCLIMIMNLCIESESE